MGLSHPDFYFSNERQFHCLRHISFHDEDQLKFLQNNFPRHQLKDIRRQLDMVGSKFDPSFVKQPMDILKSFKKASFSSRNIENNKIVFQFLFSVKDFPNGIGNSALIPMSELSTQQQATKYKVKQSNYEVWTCDVEELPTTNLLSIIALNQENTIQIVTLFPGDYAPAFPRGFGDSEEMNRMFWEGHCLLSKIRANLIP